MYDTLVALITIPLVLIATTAWIVWAYRKGII